jgi:ERCC4-type nuclease
LYFPSIKYIIKKYGEKAYYKMCICGFLKVRYDYEQSLNFDEKINLNFLIDTREQNVITLPNSQIAKLNYGDYSIEDNPNNIFIERKSLLDFIGTLSSGFDRLKRELDRCVKDNGYLIMLIEEAYPNLLEFNDRAECRRVKATPDFIMHRARELLTLYPHNLQVLAVNGRIEAARIIKRIFTIKQDIKKVDLQYHYGLGVL